MKGDDSLEQTIREENNPTSLPIMTIANPDRFDESRYRIFIPESDRQLLWIKNNPNTSKLHFKNYEAEPLNLPGRA